MANCVGSRQLLVIAMCINRSKTIGNGCIHCLHSCVWGCSFFSAGWCSSGRFVNFNPSVDHNFSIEMFLDHFYPLSMQDKLNNWRTTALILTAVFFLASFLWFSGDAPFLFYHYINMNFICFCCFLLTSYQLCIQ